MLIALKTLLENQAPMTVMALSKELHTPPSVVQAMLSHWVRKGKVALMPKSPGCGQSCHRCNPELTEIYQWVVGQAPTIS